jgi:hypothetical protein
MGLQSIIILDCANLSTWILEETDERLYFSRVLKRAHENRVLSGKPRIGSLNGSTIYYYFGLRRPLNMGFLKRPLRGCFFQEF